MTTAGVARVSAMMSFMNRLPLPPIPDLMLSLSHQLHLLPDINSVNAGASTLTSFSSTFTMAGSFNPLVPMVLPLVEGLKALLSGLDGLMEPISTSSCGTCAFSSVGRRA